MVIQAIVDGLRESVLAFSHNVEGTSPKDVLDMVLVTQYFDTMKVTRGKETCGQRGRAANAFLMYCPLFGTGTWMCMEVVW